MFSADQQIGKYRIISPIGAGGMGEVFLARDTQLERRVALKILSSRFTENAERMNRFIREAKAASALNHPNILVIHEIGEADGAHFMATEYIEGETLRTLMNAGSLTVGEIIEIGVQIAAALSAAHDAGIVHRDIKPENIMLRPDGYVKVLDFGLAKLVGSGPDLLAASDPSRAQVITRAGMIMGTAAYMSPEQARGRTVDARSDVFSLGVVLYEMLTGHQPFSGETVNHTIVSILEREPRPLSHYLEDFPNEMETVIRRCLAKAPEDRYPSAAALKSALREIAREMHKREETGGLAAGRRVETQTMMLDAETDKTLNIVTDENQKSAPAPSRLVSLSRTIRRAVGTPGHLVFFLGAVLLVIAAYGLYSAVGRPAPNAQALRLYESGADALRDGTYFKASKLFEDAVRVDEGFSKAHAGLAEAWLELDYFGRAQSAMLKVNELENKNRTLLAHWFQNEDSLYIEAVNAAVMRSFADAVRAYQKLADLRPDEPHAHLDLGRAYEKNEEIDKAIECYRRATALDSRYAAGFLRLGILLSRRAEYDKSAASFATAENLYDRQSNDEGVAEVKYQLGVSYNFQEKLDLARAHFEQVIGNQRANRHQQIRAMMQISSVCSSLGDASCAEEYASKATDLARHERMENLAASGLINLGNAYLASGAYDKAETAFQKALEFAREDHGAANEARALLALASLRIQQKRPDEAETLVGQAVPFIEKGRYQKEIAQANLLIGRAHELREKYEQALEAYSLVIASPAAPEADKAYAEMVTGLVLMKKERYPEALAHCEKSYQLYQNLKNPYYAAYSLIYLAEALHHVGRPDAAGEKLLQVQEIIRQNPVYAKYLSPRAGLLNAQFALSQRKFEIALKEAEQVSKSNDASAAYAANIITGLGRAYLDPRDQAAAGYCTKALQHAVETKNSASANSARLALADVYLVTGNPLKALEIVRPLREHLASAGRLESGWRALLIAAMASRKTGRSEDARTFALESTKTLERLGNEWGEEHFKDYKTRPDIAFYLDQLEELTTVHSALSIPNQ